MMETPCILIVDDEWDMEEVILAHFREKIRAGQYHFLFARNGEEAFRCLQTHPRISLALTDIRMPEMDGLELLKRIRQQAHVDDRFKALTVLIVSAYSDLPHIRGAMQYGAHDFLVKPLNLDDFERTIEMTLRTVVQQRKAEQFVGHSDAILDLKQQVRQLTEYQTNIMIEGETGVGKSLLARVIHHGSSRFDQPFVDLHCGAIAPTLIESELFGHVKGAFTGANRARQGKFQLADGGTLFLDEIDALSPEWQVKLLKVLDTQRFYPVGSDEAVQVNIRIIAASNRPLHQLVRDGAFRQDLYYRLNGLHLSIPPLRERPDDVIPLAMHLLAELNVRHQQQKRVSQEALERLKQAPWPGNTRELAHVLEQAMLMSPDDLIRADDLSIEGAPQPAARNLELEEQEMIAMLHRWFDLQIGRKADIFEEFERLLLQFAWQRYNGNKVLIREKLGMSRSKLYRDLIKYDIA